MARISRRFAGALLMLVASAATFVRAQSFPPIPVLTIEKTPLPKACLRQEYHYRFVAHGGVSPYTWHLEEGTLPAGLLLSSDGALDGTPKETGDFHFTITVDDSSQPPHERSQEFGLEVAVPLAAEWDEYPKVNGSRIEGSVRVSNQTKQDFDLTFIVLAVDETGRATAIGYQHFTLPKDTLDFTLPFGENLSPGSYEIHADTVGEVAKTGSIYRSHLESQQRLHIVPPP